MANRVPGRLPNTTLSAHGKEEALHLADVLASYTLDAIYCSPLDRARETAQPLSSSKNIEITCDKRLLEIDFGEWTGKTFDELDDDIRWKRFHNFRNGCRIPGGELMIEVQKRMIQFLEECNAKAPEKIIAVISHNDPIKSVLAYYLGISLDLFLRLMIVPGSISVIDIHEYGAEVKCINVTKEIEIPKM